MQTAEQAEIAQAKYAWTPQPGAQLAAIQARGIEELLFGGARGGGKSDYLLGDFLQDVETYKDAWRGILFRKSYNELEELIIRSKELYAPCGATYSETKKTWSFPNGATLKLRHLEKTRDAKLYQGHQYCVGIDTPILMSNNKHKLIRDMQVGDKVMTLNKGQEVKHVVKPYLAPCVKVKNEHGEQIQPIWHPILTDSGWKSYASILGIDSKEFAKACQEFGTLPSLNVNSRHLEPVSRLNDNHQTTYASTLYHSVCRLRVWFELSNLLSYLLASLKHQALKPILLLLRQFQHYTSLRLAFDGVAYALPDSQKASSFQSDYHQSLHLYDGLLPHLLSTLKDVLPLQAYAGIHSQIDCMMDDVGNVQKCNLENVSQYEHPYNGDLLKADLRSSFCSSEISYCGYKMVSDLNIANNNHYINADNGLINSNTWIGWDELGNWADLEAYNILKACLRAAKDVKHKRIRASANPGGAGHQAVKNYFINHAPMGYAPRIDKNTGHKIIYIPSQVFDNKILLEKDPNYINVLKGVGSASLVKAWLYGDWNVIQGAYFDGFSTDKHVIAPFKIPEHWLRFRAFDWGSSAPSACIWFAVADGNTMHPRGSLICYKELYTASAPNKGLKLTVEQVADRIKELTTDRIDYSVADPSIFKEEGGESIGERFYKSGVNFKPADNKRLAGWELIRSRLRGDGERPTLYFFSTCINLIRTLPALQHDERHPEDLDTEAEDHLCFSGDVLVDTNKGQIPIEDLENKDFLVNTRYGYKKAKGYKTGEKRLYEVVLSNGKIFNSTKKHKFLTPDGWKKLSKLKPGNFLIDLSSKLQDASKKERIVSIRPKAIDEVFCLYVPEYNEFTIEGGIVVHNCDALRYGVNSRATTRDAPSKPSNKIGHGVEHITVNNLMNFKTKRGKRKI